MYNYPYYGGGIVGSTLPNGVNMPNVNNQGEQKRQLGLLEMLGNTLNAPDRYFNNLYDKGIDALSKQILELKRRYQDNQGIGRLLGRDIPIGLDRAGIGLLQLMKKKSNSRIDDVNRMLGLDKDNSLIPKLF